MVRIEDVFDLIERIGEPIDCAGPMSEEEIQEAERDLGLRFPPSYRRFVQRFGSLGVGSEEFFGLTKPLDAPGVPNAIWYTLEERKCGFPAGLIVVQDLGEEVLYCIDTSQPRENGEGPVVAWYLDLPREERARHLRIVADSFADFVYKRLLAAREPDQG